MPVSRVARVTAAGGCNGAARYAGCGTDAATAVPSIGSRSKSCRCAATGVIGETVAAAVAAAVISSGPTLAVSISVIAVVAMASAGNINPAVIGIIAVVAVCPVKGTIRRIVIGAGVVVVVVHIRSAAVVAVLAVVGRAGAIGEGQRHQASGCGHPFLVRFHNKLMGIGPLHITRERTRVCWYYLEGGDGNVPWGDHP